MEPTRLVKLALPARLVEAMDRALERHPGYPDRSAFASDALENLLAELEAKGGELRSEAPPSRGADEPRTRMSDRPVEEFAPWERSEAAAPLTARGLAATTAVGASSAPIRLSIVAPASDVPTAPTGSDPHPNPIWGMHNRDWPTLWAASELGQVTYGGAVDFDTWVADVIERAWVLGAQLRGGMWDASGLPFNPDKPERSAGRFRSFFVGDKPGVGPLFSLRLAAPVGRDGVLLTEPGADLLRKLAGLEPRKQSQIRDDWRHAFLLHLARWVPADFAFLGELVELIGSGSTSRMALLEAVAARYPQWKESVVSTNVAGFVARGREWNLVEPQQKDRKYSLAGDAKAALVAASTEASDSIGDCES